MSDSQELRNIAGKLDEAIPKVDSKAVAECADQIREIANRQEPQPHISTTLTPSCPQPPQ